MILLNIDNNLYLCLTKVLPLVEVVLLEEINSAGKIFRSSTRKIANTYLTTSMEPFELEISFRSWGLQEQESLPFYPS
jgi:hypothetical protein